MKTLNRRDYTHYFYQGNEYGKGPLVLAIVKDYVKKHPDVTAEKLKEIFPRKEFHSPFEIVEKIRKAKKGRFFLDSAAIIDVANAKVAVTNQWGTNIDSFINFAKKNLHIKIKRTHLKAA